MRLAVVTRIYRPEPAAASIFLGAVVDSALCRGILVDVYTATPPLGTPSQTRGERVRSWPVLRDSTGYVRGYAGYVSYDVPLFFRLLFGPRPDAVLVEPPPTSGAVVRAVCALRRIPYVYDAADIWSDAVQLEPVPGVVIRVLRAVEKLALRGAAHIVTVSQGVVGRIRALGSHAPVTVTGFGADATQFTYLEMPTEKLFVYAGSYSPYHGADILVDGFARFSKQYPGYVLRFIGNGASRDTVDERARELGVSSQIEFLEPVTPAALLPHLNAAVASLATIKPDTVYEYSYASKAFSSFMTGCPVIFAGSGPTIDLIDEARAAGVRAGAASAYDAEAIAAQLVESVESLPSADERRDLALWASQNHSLQAVADRVVDVISATPARVGT
ncbi:glycosyltransferase family 4 protein [Microbacterium luteolum]|uniref:glycosyltransferase n=1 Tax=Microbacterium luteolum TaxID=69367 RepID=UPI0031D0DF6F